MKLWEVFKALAENPTDEYEATGFSKRHVLSMSKTGFYYLDIYNEQGELIPEERGGGAFNGNIKPDFEWKKVKKEVTWQDALEAWANGAGLCYLNKAGGSVYVYGSDLHLYADDITTSKWYIL